MRLKELGSKVVQYPISTSNHNSRQLLQHKVTVVQYPISTSNHNKRLRKQNRFIVVQYPISTSNHNRWLFVLFQRLLYSIQFLHQITTDRVFMISAECCIVSNFYIKSQQHVDRPKLLFVVQYPISTSNHNCVKGRQVQLIVVQYPISTSNHN